MSDQAIRRSTGRGESKDERLEARVPANLKTMFQRAADLEGVTLSDFVITALVARSRVTIREHEVITLTGRNREVFLDALQNPPKISPKLAAALKEMRGSKEHEHREEPASRAGTAKRTAPARFLPKRKRTAR
jgi:uncharacterized protein (DUF1778 family)